MLETRQQTLLLPESAADVVVRGDATLLRMLLRNLVENAHRYSPEGTHITIHISADPDAIMAVEDEGPGIDESKCRKLSEAFVRMDSRYGGIGLGLSIVSRITQLHQGQFFLQNRTERTGTRAWVLLKRHNRRLIRRDPHIDKTADNQHTTQGRQTFINIAFHDALLQRYGGEYARERLSEP